MENFSRDEINSKRGKAEEELFKMWEKSTMPHHVPPFVKLPAEPSREEPQSEEPSPPCPDIPPKTEERRGIGGLLGKDIFKFLDFKNFELNSDRMLILLMLVLLSGEDSDNILLFALAYIML